MSKSRSLRTPMPYGVAVVIIAAAFITLACADAPTKPATLSTLGRAKSAVMATRGVASPLIEDGSTRLATAVEDAVTRDRVRTLLDRLAKALDDGEDKTARTQITSLRKIITARARAADGADLAALGLALDQIESQLKAAIETNR